MKNEKIGSLLIETKKWQSNPMTENSLFQTSILHIADEVIFSGLTADLSKK